MFDKFFEVLSRPIYSDKEAALDQNKKLSTTSDAGDVEAEYVNFDPFANYTNASFRDIDQKLNEKRSLITKWRSVSTYPEVDEALQEIAGEAIVYNEFEPPVKLNLEDIDLSDKVKDKINASFEKILYMLDFNVKGEDLFRQWYIDGQLWLEVIYDNAKITDGIKKLIVLSPYNIFRTREKETGVIKYFITKNPSYNISTDFSKAEKIFLEEQITTINSGLFGDDKNVPLSFINKAIKSINQLYLIEDAVVIFRITRSPEKRVFYIDTGNLPKTKAEEYIKSLIAKYRQKKIYNVDTGTVENKAKSVSILEDFWLPRNASGKGTQIDTLQSAQGLGELTDIEYFVKKVYRSLNVPRTRIDPEAKITIGNTLDIEKDELKFFKFILKLRRKFNNLFVDLLKKDLIATKVMSINDWVAIQEKIRFVYANNNEYAEIKRLQILEMRINAAERAMAMEAEGYFSKEFIKKDVLNQSDEDIKAIKKQREKEAKEGDGGPSGDEVIPGGDGRPVGMPPQDQNVGAPVYLPSGVIPQEFTEQLREMIEDTIRKILKT